MSLNDRFSRVTDCQGICWHTCITHTEHFKLKQIFDKKKIIKGLYFADVYSFDEEEAVLDPHISEHLLHFGIDMLQMQRVCFSFPSPLYLYISPHITKFSRFSK